MQKKSKLGASQGVMIMIHESNAESEIWLADQINQSYLGTPATNSIFLSHSAYSLLSFAKQYITYPSSVQFLFLFYINLDLSL